MSGLMTTRPLSMAAVICPADQSAHCLSPVMTSSSTQESTRVAGRIGVGSLATEQRHDLVGTHARYISRSCRITQPPDQPLAPAFCALLAHYLQRTVHLGNLNLVAGMQAELGPEVRRDGHLALAVQHHGARALQVVHTYYSYYVILSLEAWPHCLYLWRSAHVKAGDGPSDDHALDLAGAFEDREDLRVAVPALHRELAGVAVAAENLHGLLGDPDRGLPRDQLA